MSAAGDGGDGAADVREPDERDDPDERARQAGDDALRPLALALVASVLLWQLPYGPYVLYPFKLVGTWLHEGSHAIAMLITGAGFERMEVFRDGSGLAHAARGSGPTAAGFIAAAGYMGAPLWGALVIAIARDARGARRALLAMGALLGVTAVLSIANRFGQVALGTTGVALVVLALVPRPRLHVVLAHFVAAQACIGAVVDIRVLYRPSLVVDGKIVRDSDAHAMALSSFGTDADWAVWLWASLWLAWSLAILFFALWRVRVRLHAEARASVDRRADVA